jgi:hypothetical protein
MGKKNNIRKADKPRSDGGGSSHGRKRANSSGNKFESTPTPLSSSSSATSSASKDNSHIPLSKEAQTRADILSGLYYELRYGMSVTLDERDGKELEMLCLSIFQILISHVIIYRFNFSTYNFSMLFICIIVLVWRYLLRTGKLRMVNKIEKNSSYIVASLLVLGSMYHSITSIFYVLLLIVPRYYMGEKRKIYDTGIKTNNKRKKLDKRSTVEIGERHQYVWVFMAIEEIVFNVVELALLTTILPALFVSSPILYYRGSILTTMCFVFMVNHFNILVTTLIFHHSEKLCEILKLQGCWVKKPNGWTPPGEEKSNTNIKQTNWDSTKLYTKHDCVTYGQNTQYITYYEHVLAIPGCISMYILHTCFVDHHFTHLVILSIQGLLISLLVLLGFTSSYWPFYLIQIVLCVYIFGVISKANKVNLSLSDKN